MTQDIERQAEGMHTRAELEPRQRVRGVWQLLRVFHQVDGPLFFFCCCCSSLFVRRDRGIGAVPEGERAAVVVSSQTRAAVEDLIRSVVTQAGRRGASPTLIQTWDGGFEVVRRCLGWRLSHLGSVLWQLRPQSIPSADQRAGLMDI